MKVGDLMWMHDPSTDNLLIGVPAYNCVELEHYASENGFLGYITYGKQLVFVTDIIPRKSRVEILSITQGSCWVLKMYLVPL